MTVEEHLAKLFPTAKKTTLKQMVQTGRVRLNSPDGQAIRRLSDVIAEGETVHVLAQAPEPPRHRTGGLKIIFEDEDLLVVSKPPGLLTATVPHEPRPTLHAKIVEYLARTSPRARIGMIHRLDKDARGLLVFSKNHPTYHALKQDLEERKITRQYHAVVIGEIKPAKGTIKSKLLERKDGKVESTTGPKGEDAVTHYETLKVGGGGGPGGAGNEKSLLFVTLETGRKHQIRVHLSEKGHPIQGDVMYNRPPHIAAPLMLAATYLAFTHPRTRQPLSFEIPVPQEFLSAVGS